MDDASLEAFRSLRRDCMTTLTLMRPALVVLFEAFHENEQVTIGSIEPEAFAACMLMRLPVGSLYYAISIAVPAGIPGNRGMATSDGMPSVFETLPIRWDGAMLDEERQRFSSVADLLQHLSCYAMISD